MCDEIYLMFATRLTYKYKNSMFVKLYFIKEKFASLLLAKSPFEGYKDYENVTLN